MLPNLNSGYNLYVGGVSDDVRVLEGSLAVNSPFVGCVRDVLILDSNISNFNGPDAYHAGAEMGVCKVEVPEPEGNFIVEI